MLSVDKKSLDTGSNGDCPEDRQANAQCFHDGQSSGISGIQPHCHSGVQIFRLEIFAGRSQPMSRDTGLGDRVSDGVQLGPQP